MALYDTALMEVGEDGVQAGAQTVAFSVYLYSDVQLAILGNRDLLAVWTADPGRTFTSLGSVGTGAYDGAISAGLTDGRLTVLILRLSDVSLEGGVGY